MMLFLTSAGFSQKPEAEIEKKVNDLLSQMTLEEKASLCSGLNCWYLKGVERLDIPSIMVTDGPHGLRKQAGDADHVGLNESVPTTCFPTASALAATWNRNLIQQVGAALRYCSRSSPSTSSSER